MVGGKSMKPPDDGGSRRKSHERTKRTRNTKGKLAAARLRQLKKARNRVVRKLKDQ